MRDYPAAFAALLPEATQYLANFFNLTPPEPDQEGWLFFALHDAGYNACDAIVALCMSMERWAIESAEMLLGHAVQRLPRGAPEAVDPILTTINRVLDKASLNPEEQRFYAQKVVQVLPRPYRREGWDNPRYVARFVEIKPGRTVRQMLSRGVTRADIKAATKAGWLILSDSETGETQHVVQS